MKLLVQDFLRDRSFRELYDAHGVSVSFSKDDRKFSLNYDMIDSIDSDKLSQQCRGLILAKYDGTPISTIPSVDKRDYLDICPGETIVLSYPMDRFFNLGQGCAANINWNDPNIQVLEKLDGTCCIVYYDDIHNCWCVSTRSSPDADIPLDNGMFTFRTLFEKALFDTTKQSFPEFTLLLDKDLTYVFELTSPYNRILVKYDDCRITLLAVRNKITLIEQELPNLCNINNVKSYSLKSANDVLQWLNTTDPMETEGVVVKSPKFERVKIKSASYVASHRMKDTLCASDRNIMEYIMLGSEDDLLSIVPEDIAEKVIRIKMQFKDWLKIQEQLYIDIASRHSVDDKKAFALEITANEKAFKSAFFSIFNKKSPSVKDYIQSCKGDNGSWSNSFIDNILTNIKG